MFEKKKESPGHIAPHSEQILGYLNLSDGREDPRWQACVNEAFAKHAAHARPWDGVFEDWARDIEILRASGAPAFKDCTQALRVLDIARELLPEYRSYHSDLLGHCTDGELFNSLFIARVLESTLRLVRSDGEKSDSQILQGAIRELSDFVGYRPVAVLERRNSGEVYDHERHRPVPIYIQGAGSVHGPLGEVVALALQYLRSAPPEVLHTAGLEPDQIREIAVDMRPYDHDHPASFRPNHPFAEWDPGQIELDGRYSRMVIRRSVIGALNEWGSRNRATRDQELILSESAALLSTTILMGSAVSGGFPGAHDSSVSLATLVPSIARARDAFHRHLHGRMPPHLKETLVEEEQVSKLPFGNIRGFLNSFIAEERALQLQQQRLAFAYAELGLAGSSTQEARRVSALSSRFQSDIIARLTLEGFDAENGRFLAGVERLSEVIDRLQAGIQCGALADPWNVLAFHGLFPIGNHHRDSTRDGRVATLIGLSRELCRSLTILQGEAAATGDVAALTGVRRELARFAEWWDSFATHQISLDGVDPVRGSKYVRAAEGLAAALTQWRERGAVPADMSFWAKNLKSLKGAESHGLVATVLMRRGDLTAAQGVLVHWLSGVESIGVGAGDEAFPNLARRWLTATAHSPSLSPEGRAKQMFRLLAQLEANSTALVEVPTLADFMKLPPGATDDTQETRFETAFENFAFENTEGGLAEVGSYEDSLFDDESISKVTDRLAYHRMFAGLIREAARLADLHALSPDNLDQVARWREEVSTRAGQALTLAQGFWDVAIAEPESGELDEHRKHLTRLANRTFLVEEVIVAAVEQRVVSSLLGAVLRARGRDVPLDSDEPEHIHFFHEVLGAALASDKARLEKAIGDTRRAVADETLFFTPLDAGGKPDNIARARFNHKALSTLSVNLARLGNFVPALDVLNLAQELQRNPSRDGASTTVFSEQFLATLESMVETVAISGKSWTGRGSRPQAVVAAMQALVRPFHDAWEGFCEGRLSSAEEVNSEESYMGLVNFIREHGDEIFTPSFLSRSYMGGILLQGTEAYLKWIADNKDDAIPRGRFFERMQDEQERKRVAPQLDLILRMLVENYDIFKDYNCSTSMSDYGSNIEKLISLLLVKAKYERDAWEMKPEMVVHQVLARHQLVDAAALWEKLLEKRTRAKADTHLKALDEMERLKGVSLRTIRDVVEQRFVKPLALDRLLALLPAVHNEAKAFADVDAEDKVVSAAAEELACPSLRRLRDGLKMFTEKPEGVGRDVPKWLKALSEGAAQARTTVSQKRSGGEFAFAPLVLLDEQQALKQIAALSKLL